MIKKIPLHFSSFLLIMVVMIVHLPLCVHAQEKVPEKETLLHRIVDTNYIVDYKKKFALRIYGLFQEAGLRNKSFNFDQISYRPNVPGRIGIAGNYKWLGLGISFGVPFLSLSEDKYGKTSFYDLRVNAYGSDLAGEFFMQNYKGYYISTSNNVYLIPDMRIFSAGVYVYYFYNYKRFSIRAAFLNNERQKKSAGSLSVRPSLIYFKFSSDEGIIPPELAALANTRSEIPVKGYFWAIGLAPGYTYTFVFFKNFYFNAGAYLGFLYQWGRYNTINELKETNGITLSMSIRSAAGYNADKWFAGLGFNSGIGSVPANLSGNGFYYDVTQFRVWVGTRFNWFSKKK